MGRSGTAALAIGLWVLEEGTLSWGPRKRSIRPKRNPPRPSLELARPGSWRRSPRRPGRRPKTRRAESPRCHEATVIFHLLRLLAWDLRLVAHAGPCL
nr:interferon lambda 4 [Bubalus bubalis]